MWEKGSIKDPWNYLLNPILLVFLFSSQPSRSLKPENVAAAFFYNFMATEKKSSEFFSLHPKKTVENFCFVFGVLFRDQKMAFAFLNDFSKLYKDWI